MPKVTGAAWPAGTPPEAQPGGWRGPHCPCWNVPVVSSSWVWGPDPVRLQLHCPPPRPRAQHPRGPTEDPPPPRPIAGAGEAFTHAVCAPSCPQSRNPQAAEGAWGLSPRSAQSGDVSRTPVSCRILKDEEGLPRRENRRRLGARGAQGRPPPPQLDSEGRRGQPRVSVAWVFARVTSWTLCRPIPAGRTPRPAFPATVGRPRCWGRSDSRVLGPAPLVPSGPL